MHSVCVAFWSGLRIPVTQYRSVPPLMFRECERQTIHIQAHYSGVSTFSPERLKRSNPAPITSLYPYHEAVFTTRQSNTTAKYAGCSHTTLLLLTHFQWFSWHTQRMYAQKWKQPVLLSCHSSFLMKSLLSVAKRFAWLQYSFSSRVGPRCKAWPVDITTIHYSDHTEYIVWFSIPTKRRCCSNFILIFTVSSVPAQIPATSFLALQNFNYPFIVHVTCFCFCCSITFFPELLVAAQSSRYYGRTRRILFITFDYNEWLVGNIL